ncbi:ParB/RepB/Spo0J family partition protein [Antrihabitans cavernicola]|uniref:ParB-like N-terminal domain-containing protein n=1 Tax=Antrihabitans cavernicola TaxID=2495913 RepID=A0A5A7SFF2_9NOCA|nr:hypothetical protein [Spelaeibacter cavernicola]KAA0024169.1 hypothetical protein FOY51_06370 [Spelaeibacter cavernicola]
MSISTEKVGERADYTPMIRSIESGVKVVHVSINMLRIGDSPRSAGIDESHVQALIECSLADLPPILVHRPSMRVIDGMHRLHVAELRGDATIRVQFFDGAAEDVFLLAVKSNTSHGLPLSLADRKMAAQRLIDTHSQLSDRSIAAVTGLSHKTVGSIRRCSAGEDIQPNTRVGRGGRVTVLDAASGRARARELFAQKPSASVREIAEAAGIAPSTALDVRRRLRDGRADTDDKAPDGGVSNPDRAEPGTSHRSGPRATPPELPAPKMQNRSDPIGATLQSLRKDPSLRFNEKGRLILRLLDLPTTNREEWSALARAVPPHLRDTMFRVALESAQAWEDFARTVKSQSTASNLPVDPSADECHRRSGFWG